MKIKQIDYCKNKLLNYNSLERQLSFWRFKQKNIVFTNGCFDLLHPGHIHCLSEAADQGDVLIIGLNSDASVKRLKGEKRPIQNQESRALILSAFQFVDAVILFEQDSPKDLINIIKPNVLVKGGDYTIDQIVGAKEVVQAGGRVHIIEFQKGHSTTKLSEKL